MSFFQKPLTPPLTFGIFEIRLLSRVPYLLLFGEDYLCFGELLILFGLDVFVGTISIYFWCIPTLITKFTFLLDQIYFFDDLISLIKIDIFLSLFIRSSTTPLCRRWR